MATQFSLNNDDFIELLEKTAISFLFMPTRLHSVVCPTARALKFIYEW